MAKTEKTLSTILKQNLPKKTFFQRIENRVGEGIPDTFICIDGNVYFIELKIIKNNRIILQKSQIAWHIKYSRCNGASFFLASSPKEGCLFLFEGGKALEIQGSRIEDIEYLVRGSIKDVVAYLQQCCKNVTPIGEGRAGGFCDLAT
jgi:Holliday junction resolvase